MLTIVEACIFYCFKKAGDESQRVSSRGDQFFSYSAFRENVWFAA